MITFSKLVQGAVLNGPEGIAVIVTTVVRTVVMAVVMAVVMVVVMVVGSYFLLYLLV